MRMRTRSFTKRACLSLGIAGLTLALLAPLPAAAAENDLPMPVEDVITKFVANETEFSKAREAYTYRQTVRILEYDDGGGVRGKFEIVQDVIFSAKGERTERVVYAPVSTLKGLILTPRDMQDMRDVQPFVMTTADRPNYDIRYLGPEKVDEIETYVFAVKPKAMKEGARYFEGQIWVDQRDLQIVKTYGKGVGILKKKSDEQFPRFETYRDQIDGKFWFPVYTRADDVLHFEGGDQRIRMVMKYEDYKQFKSESDIKFGDVIGEPGETPVQPDTPPQAKP